METLVLDGKNYVKASKAARDLGYATDYVGQLCRSGKVTAHLIGRTWYVNPDELSSHRTEKKRQSRVKAREQAHKSIEEHRVKISKASNTYKNIGIQYESDSEELIPQTRKITIQSSQSTQPTVDEDVLDNHPTITNRGEKVQMSGKVAVVDVTDGVIDNETTVLTPTRIHSSTNPKTKGVFHINTLIQNEEEDVAQKVDFAQKLQAHDVAFAETESVTDPVLAEVSLDTHDDTIQESQQGTVLTYVLIVLVASIVSLSSIPLSLDLMYINDGSPRTQTSFNFSLDKTLDLLRLKI